LNKLGQETAWLEHLMLDDLTQSSSKIPANQCCGYSLFLSDPDPVLWNRQCLCISVCYVGMVSIFMVHLAGLIHEATTWLSIYISKDMYPNVITNLIRIRAFKLV
jgi:hypothetical protein